jgi:CheY-like chemotaxis protein
MDSVSRKLILIADDDVDSREMYAVYLRDSGFCVALARDGADAFARARELRPAVVVLDLHMPRVDGIGATRNIRCDASIGDTPIVVVTADDIREEDALDAGATAVCVKPYAPQALLTRIQELLA